MKIHKLCIYMISVLIRCAVCTSYLVYLYIHIRSSCSFFFRFRWKTERTTIVDSEFSSITRDVCIVLYTYMYTNALYATIHYNINWPKSTWSEIVLVHCYSPYRRLFKIYLNWKVWGWTKPLSVNCFFFF